MLPIPCGKCGKPAPSSPCGDCRARFRKPDTRRNRNRSAYQGGYLKAREQLIEMAWRLREPCVICGKPFAKRDQITAEHIVPVREGGRSELSNLGPAHHWCNSSRKPARRIDPWI